MRLFPVAFFLLWATADAADQPTTPRQQMTSEIASLQAAQMLAQATRTAPPTEEEIAAASQIYKKLIARYPKEAEPHVAFGEFLHSQQRNEAAFTQWQRALEIDPARHDVLALQSDLLIQTGQVVAAADALEKAAALAPENAEYQYGLAHVYTLFRNDLAPSRHLSTDALIVRGTEYFRRAAELAPENLTYARAYAEAFYTESNPDWTLAKAAWEALLPRSPDKDFVHSHLVRVNIRLHDKTAALDHLAQLTDPAFAALKVALQKQIDKL